MKKIRKNAALKKYMLFLIIGYFTTVISIAYGQSYKTIIYDSFHGENPKKYSYIFNGLLPDSSNASIKVDSIELSENILRGKYGLIIFSPTKSFQVDEKQAIVKYLLSGGSLLLIFDEEKRMSLNRV